MATASRLPHSDSPYMLKVTSRWHVSWRSAVRLVVGCRSSDAAACVAVDGQRLDIQQPAADGLVRLAGAPHAKG